MLEDQQWKIIKKRFDERERADKNAGRNVGRSPRGLKPTNRRTRNAEGNVRMNSSGPSGSTVHNTASDPRVNVGNHFMPILRPLPDRPPAQSPSQPDDYLEPVRGDYIPDSHYAQAYEHMRPQMMHFIDTRDRRGRENGVAGNCNGQPAHPGPDYCIAADVPQESLNRGEEYNSLYSELDENQIMEVDRDEETPQL